MKRTILAMTAALVAAFAVAADAPKAKRGHPKGRNPSGGIVEKAYAGNVIRAFNGQTVIPADKVAALTLQMRYETIVPFETVGAKPMTFAEAENAAAGFIGKDKVGAAVVIVNDPSKSDFYRASPEGRWAVLNVSPLKADNPAQERLEERFAKVYWHAVVRALGGGYAAVKPSVMTPFSDLKTLDAIPTTKPSPDVVNMLIDTGSLYGIRTITIASYRTACRNGWAPPPTNDVQRTIWNQVHQIPDKPITIEFDPKKDK